MSTTSVPVADLAVGGGAAKGEQALLVAGEQAGREAVAPLDLAEERLAVLGVADRARAHGEGALGAERLDPAPVVGEAVAHARDREGEEPASAVDVLAELREDQVALDFLDAAVLDVRHEQAGGVGAQIDGGDAHRRSHDSHVDGTFRGRRGVDKDRVPAG